MFDQISTGIGKLLQKVFGSQNQRFIDSLTPVVQSFNALEPRMLDWSTKAVYWPPDP